MRGVELLDEPCARPPDFDLAAFWAQSTASFAERLPRYPATLRVAPAILARVRSGERYTRVEREEPPDAAGRVTLVLAFQRAESACEYILGFGPQIEVLAPTTLRDEVIRAAEGVVALYAAVASAW